MYRIISEGVQIALTETLYYIKKHSNGSYVRAEKEDAEGVAVNSTPYSILGKEPLDGAVGTVIIKEFDGAAMLAETDAKMEYIAMMADIELEEEEDEQ